MKKNIFLTIILGVASILIIFFGRQHAATQEEEMLQNSLSAESSNESLETEDTEVAEEQDDEDSLSAEEKIAAYEADIDSLTPLQRIDYETLVNDPVNLAYYGPIDTSLEWYNQMNTLIQNNVSGTVEIEEYTYPETGTYNLYIQRYVDNVIASEADVVIYRMPAFEDHDRDVALSETNQFLTSMLNTLTEGLPDADIFLMETEPNLFEMTNNNSRSLDYRNYMNEMNTVADEFGLQVIDIHNQFTTIAEEDEVELASLFNEDQTVLNEEGNALLERAIDRAMKDGTPEED
ncbi:SGNH/GDSL hydrolase family protein [Marinilactibacillus kalidii]|uniref:SGNH/GDSL hydrolase family protein n=1 Tax=Marinilactibacillus kalidii TaxID=2820274 RepID=UPI001ABE4194|nr:SGNH/GDSL hydrolase family protein [Marinilactibacillus kalidii]